jgi:hypothetical protein
LAAIAVDDEVKDRLHLFGVRYKNTFHTIGRCGGRQSAYHIRRKGPAVIDHPAALALGDSREQAALVADRGLGTDPSLTSRREPHLTGHATGAGGKAQVFRGTAEAGVEMVIIRVDDGGTPGKIGQHDDIAAMGAKLPRLCVVAVRRQRGISDQIPDFGFGRERLGHLIQHSRIVRILIGTPTKRCRRKAYRGRSHEGSPMESHQTDYPFGQFECVYAD